MLAGEQAHVTVGSRAGCSASATTGCARSRPTTRAGCSPTRCETALGRGTTGPTIVCAQAGELNTGAFDPIARIVDLCRDAGAWCHIDGAFGLWAAASPTRRGLLDGFERADSWATDGHKWLNVPYDCGIAVVADAPAHRAAMTSTSPYIPAHDEDIPWGFDWNPGVLAPRAWAAGLRGVALARPGRRRGDRRRLLRPRPADGGTLAAADGVEVLNEVVLNQVLVRFGDSDEVTERGDRRASSATAPAGSAAAASAAGP